MCLYIRDIQPRVAERDIVVLKYLRQDGKRYESPYQATPVTLGSLMIAQPDIPDISYEGKDLYDREIFSIHGGVIHAMLNGCSNCGNYCAKAVIPKGTKYWVDSLGMEIAARQMLITEAKGTNESVSIRLFKEILKSAPQKNGIRVGDYQMINDSFVHPTKEIARTKVRGIVCGFYEDGNPIICALEMFREVWDTYSYSKIGEHTFQRSAMRLFNGREVTTQYKTQIKVKGGDKERFGAFERCINYRKDKKEDWYFGSLGETMTMLDNAVYLNAAHNITGLGFIIDPRYWYESCTEYNSFCTWGCHLGRLGVYCAEESKGRGSGRVVPFYASTKQKKSMSNTLCKVWKINYTDVYKEIDFISNAITCYGRKLHSRISLIRWKSFGRDR